MSKEATSVKLRDQNANCTAKSIPFYLRCLCRNSLSLSFSLEMEKERRGHKQSSLWRSIAENALIGTEYSTQYFGRESKSESSCCSKSKEKDLIEPYFFMYPLLQLNFFVQSFLQEISVMEIFVCLERFTVSCVFLSFEGMKGIKRGLLHREERKLNLQSNEPKMCVLFPFYRRNEDRQEKHFDCNVPLDISLGSSSSSSFGREIKLSVNHEHSLLSHSLLSLTSLFSLNMFFCSTSKKDENDDVQEESLPPLNHVLNSPTDLFKKK